MSTAIQDYIDLNQASTKLYQVRNITDFEDSTIAPTFWEMSGNEDIRRDYRGPPTTVSVKTGPSRQDYGATPILQPFTSHFY